MADRKYLGSSRLVQVVLTVVFFIPTTVKTCLDRLSPTQELVLVLVGIPLSGIIWLVGWLQVFNFIEWLAQ